MNQFFLVRLGRACGRLSVGCIVDRAVAYLACHLPFTPNEIVLCLAKSLRVVTVECGVRRGRLV